MGSSSSVPQFVAKFEKAAQAVGSNRPAVEATAMVAKKLFIGSAAAVGVGRAAPPGDKASLSVSARYDIKGSGSQHTALIRYTGPAHLMNNPTKAHEIRPRMFVGTRGTKARAQKGAALMAAFGLDARSGALGGGVVTVAGHPVNVIHHPGTKGLKFAEKAKALAAIECPKTYRRVGLTDPLHKVFS
jgi:hypothetical protein